MASGISVLTKALNINNMHTDRIEYVEGTAVKNGEEYPCDHIVMYSRPFKRIRYQCPICRRTCSIYDHQAKEEVTWRASSLNGVPVLIKFQPVRIHCPEHGVRNEYVPWADGRSRFTADFCNDVAFMALTCPKTVVSQYMAVNWRTVGECIARTHDRLEPDVTVRLHGLKRFCVDETSYRKGHKYITVVYDMDRNRVVWVHEGYGDTVFEEFCKALTPEEREAIEVVAGDGAKWIDRQCDKYFPNARRCIDFFHAVGWVNDALDRVRNNARAKAANDVERMKEEFKEAEAAQKKEIENARNELKKARKELKAMPKHGRPSKRRKELEQYIASLEKQLKDLKEEHEVKITDEEYQAAVEELSKMPKRGRRSKRKAELLTIIELYERAQNDKSSTLSDAHKKIINDMEKKARDIKGAKYALGMNPENLNESSRDKLKLIEESHPDVFRAYQLKEKIRAILHMKDAKTAAIALDQWIEEAKACGMKPMEELAVKIAARREGLLNAVELQVNSSRSEATNTTIKSLIATARGFKNMHNMFALIYLRCSDLVVPLHNRYQPSAQKQRELRDLQNERKRQREEAKRKLGLL